MTLVTTLTLIHETEDSAHYAEGPGEDRHPLLGTLSLQKWALPSPTPRAIRMVLESYDPAPPPSRPPRVATGRPDAVEGALKKDVAVRIVKNRLADIHQPPEWLEQYLGRKGTVLWTTVGGAMVKLDDQATWFPYAELEVED